MNSITLKSPAKLNLFLRVVNKRSDGYHNLITLFERVDLCDRVHLRTNRSGKIRIFCAHRDVPKGPKNLCYRAVQLLKEDFKLNRGVDIKITKRIPVAAGLAGGSSNTAAVLLGLNTLWDLSLSRQKLAGYAKKLGSDVAFFIYRCPWAVGTGRGDRIKPLNLRKKLWHVLVTPRIKVYSRQIFAALNLKLTKKSDNVNMLLRALRKNDLVKAGRLLVNDLETTTVRFHPNLLKIKDLIRKYNAKGVCLSGSGPTIFALVESKKEARQIKMKLAGRYRQVFVAQTL